MLLVPEALEVIDLVDHSLDLEGIIGGLERVIVIHGHTSLSGFLVELDRITIQSDVCSQVDFLKAENSELGLYLLIEVAEHT